MGGREQLYIQKLEAQARNLRLETQAELWKPNPDLKRLKKLFKEQADLVWKICDLMGADA